MPRRLLLPALALMLPACATIGTQGPPPQHRLADRLPPRVGPFERQQVVAIDGTSGNLQVRYVDPGSGAFASVFILKAQGTSLPDGAASDEVQKDVANGALAIGLIASSRAGLQINRGLDFSVTDPGKTIPNMDCAEFRLSRPPQPRLQREMVCSTVVETLLVRIRTTVTHNPEQMDAARLHLAGFSDRAIDLMRGTMQPNAAETAPQPAGAPASATPAPATPAQDAPSGPKSPPRRT